MSVLRLEHVTKRFGGLVAVNDLSFEVKERQIHALIGPNGSGKSTSINMINGSFPVTSGKIYFNDKDITGWKMHKIAAAGMGRTYQNLKLFRSMTALENVMIGGQLHAKMNFARFLVDPFKTKREDPRDLAGCGLRDCAEIHGRVYRKIHVGRAADGRAVRVSVPAQPAGGARHCQKCGRRAARLALCALR